MSSIRSLQVLEFLSEQPLNVTQIAKRLGWFQQTAESTVNELAALGLVQRGSDRQALCYLMTLQTRPHRADRMTEQAILLNIRRAQTIPALMLRSEFKDLPRSIIEDTLQRAMISGELTCSCVGMLAVFRSNLADQPNHPPQ